MAVSVFCRIFAAMNQRKKRERITDSERKEARCYSYTITGMSMSEGPVIVVSSIILVALIMVGAYFYYIAIKKY